MPILRIEQVSIREGQTVGIAIGKSDTDPGIAFVVAGDRRMMAEIASAIADGDEVSADVPDWAIVARLELPEG